MVALSYNRLQGPTMKVAVYIIEKYTGLRDENGVDLYYAVAVKLNRISADNVVKNYNEPVRVRKLIATKD